MMRKLSIFLILLGTTACKPTAPSSEHDDKTPSTAPTADDVHAHTPAPTTRPRVLIISADGLAPRFIEPLIRDGALPALAQLQARAAWTHEARTDPGLTITVPNHTGMLTGRPALAMGGRSPGLHHGIEINYDPGSEHTLHSYGNDKLSYVPSVFDVAHDHGLRTGFFVSKDKLILIQRSYDTEHGAPDATPPDHGRGKIDRAELIEDTAPLTAAFVEALPDLDLAFLHLRDTDSAGHRYGWGSREYHDAARRIDARLTTILSALERDPRPTWLIFTSDHGGDGHSHGASARPENFTIPFYLLGPDIPPGADLYTLTPTRDRPAPDTNPTHPLPIRNLDAAQLALSLLALPLLDETLQQELVIER